MAISDWPIAERPRERLLAKGASILSDAELLAVLLRTGLRGKSAVELARELLEQFNGLTGLFSAGSELAKVKGLGDAKRAQFAAAIFAHTDPSGAAQPSQADELLTRNLKEALALVDVKVLDHFIVAGSHALSFAERGLL